MQTPDCRAFAGALDTSAVSTTAMVFLCFDLADNARLQAKLDFAVEQLRRFALCGLDFLNSSGGGVIHCNHGGNLTLDASGGADLSAFFAASNNGHVVLALRTTWRSMHNEGLLAVPDFGYPTFCDLVRFMASARKFKKSKSQKPWATATSTAWESLRNGLVKFLASCLNLAVQKVIREVPDISDRSLPSRKSKKRNNDSEAIVVLEPGVQRPKKKGHCQVDVASIYNMNEEAHQAGLSLQMYLRTKARERQGGATNAAAEYWQRKIHCIYQKRCNLAFRCCRFFNIVSDSSRFSSRDTVVSALFDPENNVGCYLNQQVVKQQSKLLAPDELRLDSHIERLAAQRKIDRLASYRFLQALSNQLKQLTDGAITLATFCHDGGSELGLFLKAMSCQELRLRESNAAGDVTQIKVVNKQTQEIRVLKVPENLDDIKVLSIGLDQGPCGMGAAAFLQFNGVNMVNFYFDPYHRVIRDMKLDTVGVGPKSHRQKLQQALLCSTYIFSLSYRPFGGGGFFTDKQEILEHFMRTEYQVTRMITSCIRFAFFPLIPINSLLLVFLIKIKSHYLPKTYHIQFNAGMVAC